MLVESATDGLKNQRLVAMVTGGPSSALVVGAHASALSSELAKQKPACNIRIVDQRGSTDEFELPQDGGPFDLLMLLNVLEEQFDPADFLRAATAMLAPRAQVIAAVPNLRNLAIIGELLAGRWTAGKNPRAIRFFALKTIADAFMASGYKIEAIDPYRDSKVPLIAANPGGTVSVTVGNYIIKALDEQDVVEFGTLEFLMHVVRQ